MNTPPLFTGLVDDAGLFPPEELSMPAAVARHRGYAHPVLTGRFLCPAARVPELLTELTPGERLPLVIVSPDRTDLTAALARVAGDSRVVLAGVEVPFGHHTVPIGVPVHVEVPVTDHDAITAPAVKVRCGGLRPELFPSAGQLGAFVHACAAKGVPFKATAGLHHALPYRDDRTGFAHHGFLNLLLAACRAVHGSGREDVVAVLRETDAAALVAEASRVTDDHAADARRLFTSYGSCSTSEPVDDLRALGLLAEVPS